MSKVMPPTLVINMVSLVALSPSAGDSNSPRQVGEKYSDARSSPDSTITLTPSETIDADFDFTPYKPAQYLISENSSHTFASKTVDRYGPMSVDAGLASLPTTSDNYSKYRVDIAKKSYEDNASAPLQTYYGKA